MKHSLQKGMLLCVELGMGARSLDFIDSRMKIPCIVTRASLLSIEDYLGTCGLDLLPVEYLKGSP